MARVTKNLIQGELGKLGKRIEKEFQALQTGTVKHGTGATYTIFEVQEENWRQVAEGLDNHEVMAWIGGSNAALDLVGVESPKPKRAPRKRAAKS